MSLNLICFDISFAASIFTAVIVSSTSFLPINFPELTSIATKASVFPIVIKAPLLSQILTFFESSICLINLYFTTISESISTLTLELISSKISCILSLSDSFSKTILSKLLSTKSTIVFFKTPPLSYIFCGILSICFP